MAKDTNRYKEKRQIDREDQQPEAARASTGIRDNYRWGTVGNFLKDKIQAGSSLSVVSAYFTIYAFEALKEQLKGIADLRFLYGEPRFLKSLDPEKTDKKAFKIEDDGLQLANRLEQKRVAKECEEWIIQKVQIRSVKQTNLLHGKMYHEFTLDDFRMELTKYVEANRAALAQAPFGLYAIVPPAPGYPQIVPGVIFCLRQLGDTSGNEQVNPLQPYFLVYVRGDGIVRYTFAQPKQILEIYRVLCVGKTVAYETLCNLFDAETRNGADMNPYSELLRKAVDSIVHTFKKRALTGLLSGRSGVLVEANKQVTSTSDFQLMIWLVIKDPEISPLP